jgi:hypothetical protein
MTNEGGFYQIRKIIYASNLANNYGNFESEYSIYFASKPRHTSVENNPSSWQSLFDTYLRSSHPLNPPHITYYKLSSHESLTKEEEGSLKVAKTEILSFDPIFDHVFRPNTTTAPRKAGFDAR